VLGQRCHVRWRWLKDSRDLSLSVEGKYLLRESAE
jgi:hypothetical protein